MNAEHAPAGTIAVVRDLLVNAPGTHILLTARRRLTERLGTNRAGASIDWDTSLLSDDHRRQPARVGVQAADDDPHRYRLGPYVGDVVRRMTSTGIIHLKG